MVGAMPTHEGTCTKCKASVCGEPRFTKDWLLEVVISAHKPAPSSVGYDLVILKPDDVKSYTMREGVRVP